jgi:hypothetical protein
MLKWMEKKLTERVEEILFQYQSTMYVKMNGKETYRTSWRNSISISKYNVC